MLNKLKNFYLNLPNDILESSEEAEYNRETRRQLKRYKKTETKINYILKDETRHKTFIKYIYQKYCSPNNKSKNIKQIIASIDEKNFIESMIYMLKEFYDNIEFKEYILSDDYDNCFENFLNTKTSTYKNEVDKNEVNKNEVDKNEVNKNEVNKNEVDKNEVDKNEVNKNEVDKNEVNKNEVNKYIVSIEQKNGFYNIYPLIRIENNKLKEIFKEDYPDYGNINVNPYSEFSKRNYDIKSSLWICEFNDNQLEFNSSRIKINSDSGVTRFKINGDELIKSKSIYSLHEEGIYEIVELSDINTDQENWIYKDKIFITNKPMLEKVYIKDRSYIYGPFKYEDNNRGGGYYLDKKDNDYIVQKFSIEENKLNLSIIEIYNQYDYNNSYIKAVYFYNKENLISESIDTIDDNALINKLKEVLNTNNTNYSRREIQEIRKNIRAIVDNNLSQQRKERIKTLINNTEMTEKFIENDIIDIIELLLENEENQKGIVDKILKKPENLRKLQKYKMVEDMIQEKQKKLENLQQELNSKNEELQHMNINEDNIFNKDIKKLTKETHDYIKQMEGKKEKIKDDIEKLTEKYNLCSEIDKLIKEKEKIESDAQKAKEEYNVFSRNSQDIQKNIKEKLDSITSISKYSDIAFDGIIANEILESAAKWSKNKNMKSFEQQIADKESVQKFIEVKSFKDKEIIDYIYDGIKRVRNYSKNDVINIMICLTQGFLTVFAGEPGVGKTSLCNIIASVLGLYNENSIFNRFTEISVEKGWTSKRDLIGYYNPLTKSFDKNNSSLFKVFNILNQEYKMGINDFPYYILLDEANLSPMEYYWADFMDACDLDKQNRKINLGEDYIYNMPKTLRFLATINYDHTTETLSPRLIDRSWIILLESNDFQIDDYDFNINFNEVARKDSGIIMFKDLQEKFACYEYDNSNYEAINTVYEVLKDIYVLFKENNINISPRINNMIKIYLKVGCNLFEDTEARREFVALDYAVAQKLLPKINGCGNEYKYFLEKLYEKFDSKNMMKCKNIIQNIIKKGDNNMQYYQFFA